MDVEPPFEWRLNKCSLWRAELEADVPAGPLDPAEAEVGYCKHRYSVDVKGLYHAGLFPQQLPIEDGFCRFSCRDCVPCQPEPPPQPLPP